MAQDFVPLLKEAELFLCGLCDLANQVEEGGGHGALGALALCLDLLLGFRIELQHFGWGGPPYWRTDKRKDIS